MEKSKVVIAVSGKGGVGKTTVAALIIKVLTEVNGRAMLIVDADPDSNLGETLGLAAEKTISKIATKFKDDISTGKIPPGVVKKDLFESRIFEALNETPKFDLLVMGRGEGEGCYCTVNNFLISILDTLTKNYQVTIMDTEAGLEHLSRRTDRDVDLMLIVVDMSRMSFETAKRIKELAEEVHINFKRIILIANKIEKGMEDLIAKKAEEMAFELAGIIPINQELIEYDLKGESLLNLPNDNDAVVSVEKALKNIGII